MRIRTLLPAALAAVSTLAACGEVAKLPVEAGMGPHPELPAPNTCLLYTSPSPRDVEESRMPSSA